VRINPHNEARRLIATLDPDFLGDLASDPMGAIPILYEDLTVTLRTPSTTTDGCAVDGTYHPGPPPRITVANDVALSRQRFTGLHELGHHLIELDPELNDLSITDADRRDEAICNEIAACILLPDTVVAEFIPVGTFTAEDVAKLHGATNASRAACCVAALRQLHKAGCVILGRGDGMADFTAHHIATPWRLARMAPQGPESLLAKAAERGHARAVTRVSFASGRESGELQGDAFAASDGWVFMVAIDDSHSPWERGLHMATADDRAPTEVVECPRCDKAFTAHWPAHKACGEYRCPECKKCGCVPSASEQVCTECRLLKAKNLFRPGQTVCRDCE
jgi:hypothetical protein